MRYLREIACGLVVLGTWCPSTLFAVEPQFAPAQSVGNARAAASTQAPAPTSLPSPIKHETAERDRLWQQAQDFGAKQDWSAAIRAGRAAFVLQTKNHTDQPLTACEMLEGLAFWSTQQRDFSGALATSRELTRRRSRLLGERHPQTVEARLNEELIERLSKLSAHDWDEFQLADKLHQQAATLQRAGENAGALAKAEQALPIYTRLLGRDQALRLSCLANVILCRVELGHYLAAYTEVQELIELVPPLKGPTHPDTILSMTLLARFNESTGHLKDAEDAYRKLLEFQTTINGPGHPETWSAATNLGKVLSDRDEFAAAHSILEDILQQQVAVLGKDHPATAQTTKILGTTLCRAGNFAAAEPLLNDAVATFRKQVGEEHVATASALNARGRFYLDTGRINEAEKDLGQSLKICTANFGDGHPTTGKVLENQARLYELRRDLGHARQVRTKCLQIVEHACGESSLPTADALEALARTYVVMNDFGLAEPYLLRARVVRTKLLGREHPQTAAIIGQLAYVYLGVGEPQRAEPLYLEALTTLSQSDEPALSIRFRKQLALLYQSVGRFDEAETQYRRVLATRDPRRHNSPLLISETKIGLAQTVLSRGDAAEACRLIDEVLTAYRPALPADDPQWLDALAVAGMSHLAAGNFDRAADALTQGLQVAQSHLERSSDFESERQQLVQMKTMRHLFDMYLSLPSSSDQDAAALYRLVLAWKGCIASRQWQDRQYASPETEPLNRELQQVSRKLATLTLKPPDVSDREAWMGQIFALNLRKEELEQQRAVIVNGQSARPIAHGNAADVEQALPVGTALIDFLQYTHTSFVTNGDTAEMKTAQRHVAFILRPDRPIVRIELGETAPIEEAVSKWHQTRGFAPKAGSTDWAAAVGKLVWEPLKPHVADCRTLLISPDGNLSLVAWNALPGRAPNSYLVEDYAIGLAPVPQLLSAMQTHREPANDSGPDSLLLVGDVDYDASTTTDAESDSVPQVARAHFAPLKGTALEVHALRDQFARHFSAGKVTLLDHGTATESAVWSAAPQHRWLHIATHGFFAPPNIMSAVAAQNRMEPAPRQTAGISIFHVGFLNGLALSGANRGAIGDGDDGILTAAELANVDLRHVDLAVLSGCETGLGEVQRGEGSFGMVRALHIAGAGTTVGSLWPVSDTKTNLLMQRFYTNLWEKKLPKLEALREAQVWLLNTSGKPSPASGTTPVKRLSPHYWAPFTLSGNWR